MQRKSSPLPHTSSQSSLANDLLLLVEAEEMRRSLKHFVIGAWSVIEPSPYIDGWVVDALCDHLTALTTGQIRFLLINVPPRHSKSTICSVLWPVWCWLHKPEDRFLCASYALNLAIRDNMKKRTLIESGWFQKRYGRNFFIVSGDPDIRLSIERDFTLSGEQNAKRFFMNDRMGYQLAVSVGSTTTGEGGSKLLIDDCHSASEAHHQAERESALIWFRETWSNRMNDASKDVMLVIGQRIDESDVSGLIQKERPDWIHLNLPAEYEPSKKCFTSIGWEDPRTQEGELLWPERFSTDVLKRYKRDLGSIGYAAQYQQSPAPSSGGFFKQQWFSYFSAVSTYYEIDIQGTCQRILESDVIKFITVDLAISEKQSADFTVFAVWGCTPDKNLFLLDIFRDHIDNPTQQKTILGLYQRYQPSYIVVESVAYQLSFVQQLRKLGLPVREFKPVKDKVARAITAAVMYESGKVFHLKGAHWLVDVEQELLLFPKAAHDDVVDVVSMACEQVTQGLSEGGGMLLLESLLPDKDDEFTPFW